MAVQKTCTAPASVYSTSILMTCSTQVYLQMHLCQHVELTKKAFIHSTKVLRFSFSVAEPAEMKGKEQGNRA